MNHVDLLFLTARLTALPAVLRCLLSRDYNAYQAAQRVQIVPPKARLENPMAKKGLICGIVSMATMYFGCLNCIPVILGIVFSLKGLSDANKLGNRGSAIAGLSLSIVGGVLGLYATVMFILRYAGMLN